MGRKRTVEESEQLDINRLVRDGVFDVPSCTGTVTRNSVAWSESLVFAYETNLSERWIHLAHRAPDRDGLVNYRVPLTTTPLPWGGVRWWLACPLCAKGGKERRIAKLYLPPGAERYGCRRCHGLTYTSCQESGAYDRLYAIMAAHRGWDARQTGLAVRRSIREPEQERSRSKKNEQRRWRRKAKGWA